MRNWKILEDALHQNPTNDQQMRVRVVGVIREMLDDLMASCHFPLTVEVQQL